MAMVGRLINETLSFFLFSILDVIDIVLCFAYKVADFCFESEWKPCYCSSPKEEAISSRGNKILVSDKGLCSSARLQLEEVSDTLYTRPSLVAELSKVTAAELRRLKVKPFLPPPPKPAVGSTFTVNSTIVEMLQDKINGRQYPIARWSDCDCKLCTCWCSSKKSLFVRAQGPKGNLLSPDRSISFNFFQPNIHLPAVRKLSIRV